MNLFIGNMYNKYICALQACKHLTLKFFIQDLPSSAKVPQVVDFKSVFFSLIIGPKGLVCEVNLQEIMGWESSDVVRSDASYPMDN